MNREEVTQNGTSQEIAQGMKKMKHVYNTIKNWCEHETSEKRASEGSSSEEMHNKVLIGLGLSQFLIEVPDPAQELIGETYV